MKPITQTTRTLPRTLVTASAGSGKTYRLSTEILDLLARGAEPGSILASTFTRKAAGEILERVLLRLAEAATDPEKARILSADTDNESLADPARCQALLQTLLGQLHQLNVSTLDAFFVRIVRSFFHTLGLPPTWSLADPEVEGRLREDTLSHLMTGLQEEGGHTILSMLFGGQYQRNIHSQLKEGMEELLQSARLDQGSAAHLWELDLPVPPLDEAALKEKCQALIGTVQALPLPTTRTGSPHKPWQKARDALVAVLENRDWGEAFRSGLGGALIADPDAPTYYGHPLDEGWLEALDAIRELGRGALYPDLARRLQALRQLAHRIHTSYLETQSRLGVLRFEDVTLLLGDPDLQVEASELHYRLDQDVQHILLDEFQDTSEIQWAALLPLVEELLSGHRESRAAVLVADPKQSIYGWRKARPELVHHIGTRYALNAESLTTSWRSSKVILSAVQSAFSEIERNPVIRELPSGPEVARAWMADFTEMEAAKSDLPGYVCAHRCSPTNGKAAGVVPEVLREAARVIRDLHEASPNHSLGVLVRQNRTVGYLIAELKALGVAVSGEGGAPLTDTVPVLGLLSLLRLADHPGDRVARYHVLRTPIQALVSFSDLDDHAGAQAAASELRQTLVRDGYGRTLAAWTEALRPHCTPREQARLRQLVELAHRWDLRATLRPADFVRHVESTVVEDPSAAPVRVMTIHKSKGLEFDIVALPDLYHSLSPLWRRWLIPRRSPTGEVEALFPSIRKDLEIFFPEITEARATAQQPDVRDSLSLLYVALTRPRQALHLFIPENGGGPRSAAQLLSAALDIPLSTTGTVLKSWGDPEWFTKDERGQPRTPETLKAPEGRPALQGPSPARKPPRSVLLLPPPAQARRNLPRRSPSQSKGSAQIDLSLRLHLGGRQARDRGTLVHAWCEAIPWIEDGIPGDPELQRLAVRHAPGLDAEERTQLISTFRGWLGAPEIIQHLERSLYWDRYPEAELDVHPEFPFVDLADGFLQEGFVDRLVLVRSEGKVIAAHVLDFKTDRVVAPTAEATEAALASRTERYRPQIMAYTAMIQRRFHLPPDAVRGTLLFLEAGRAVDP